ncbi:MAG: hypothetical protein ACREBG_10605 [Pyrinomonadaceae bacterium]
MKQHKLAASSYQQLDFLGDLGVLAVKLLIGYAFVEGLTGK